MMVKPGDVVQFKFIERNNSEITARVAEHENIFILSISSKEIKFLNSHGEFCELMLWKKDKFTVISAFKDCL